MTVGVGMIPRGEVGLVFATLGLASGVLDASQHATLLIVVLVSTIVAPPWLRKRVERRDERPSEGSAEPPPAEGWLAVTDDEVELRAEPPVKLAPRIGLEAALRCADRRPGPKLLDWLSGSQGLSARWDAVVVAHFLALLRDGNIRSWRLLEVTGLLEVLFPDIANAAGQHRQDPFDLDPAAALRLDEVEALKDLVGDPDDPASRFWSGVDQDAVLLAAFVRSVFGDQAPSAVQGFTTSLALGDERASFVEFLVVNRDLLPAAAARLAMGAEESVLELAAHVGDRARCDALYLAAAAGERGPTARERLDELHALVRSALSLPEVEGAETHDLVEARKREAKRLLPRSANVAVHELLDAAPRRYVLAHSPQAIALHLQMLDPPPTRGEIRLRPEPQPDAGWTVYVTALDRPGTLEMITSAFARCEMPVVEASITTWEGMAADVFHVVAPPTADWEAVRKAAAGAFHQPVRNGKPPAIEGQLDVDNAASPWHTIVEIRAFDRAGLLHRVAEVFSRAGLTIHHATVRTVNDVAVDTFLVTGRDGHKLDRRDQTDLRLSFEGRLRSRWTPARLWRRPTRAQEPAAR